MRVTVYDKNPGPGFSQWFLKISWFLGCWIQRLFGAVDAYYGAASWDDALDWLAKQPKPLLSIQYWGHGSPGTVWLAGASVNRSVFGKIIPSVKPETVLWFRTCSTFQGQAGHDFSKYLTELLNCTVAAHTRIVGVFQGGLHTRKPKQEPSWPLSEGEFKDSKLAKMGLKWGTNTVFCLATKIPKGW
jgi:hypothetical protein